MSELRAGLRVGAHVLVAPGARRPEAESWSAEPAGGKGAPATLVFYRESPQFLAKPAQLETLVHPNVARFEEFGFIEGRPVLRREAVAGESLSSRIDRSGALMPFEVRDVLSGVLPALAAAHGLGVFHGGLDADDVLLGAGGVVKVAGIGVIPAGLPIARVGIRSDLRDVAKLAQRMFSGGPAPVVLAERLEGPGVDDAWWSFFTRLKGEGEEAFATAEEALDALRAIPTAAPRAPRRLPSWIAGPVLIAGCFLVGYVAGGMFPYPGVVRLLGGAAGAILVAAGWRGVARPRSSVLFWTALFWTIAARPVPAVFGAGIVLTLAAAALRVVASLRRRGLPSRV